MWSDGRPKGGGEWIYLKNKVRPVYCNRPDNKEEYEIALITANLRYALFTDCADCADTQRQEHQCAGHDG